MSNTVDQWNEGPFNASSRRCRGMSWDSSWPSDGRSGPTLRPMHGSRTSTMHPSLANFAIRNRNANVDWVRMPVAGLPVRRLRRTHRRARVSRGLLRSGHLLSGDAAPATAARVAPGMHLQASRRPALCSQGLPADQAVQGVGHWRPCRKGGVPAARRRSPAATRSTSRHSASRLGRPGQRPSAPRLPTRSDGGVELAQGIGHRVHGVTADGAIPGRPPDTLV